MLHRTLSTESLVPYQWLVVLSKPADTKHTGASDVLILDASGEGTPLTCSLGKRMDAPESIRCYVRCHTLDTWHAGSAPAYTGRTSSPTAASSASVRCLKIVNILSNHELSKMKFDPLDLRTLSELPAPHLNLKPCLGQATHLSPQITITNVCFAATNHQNSSGA